MSYRTVIEHALRVYYAEHQNPAAFAGQLLARYDAERPGPEQYPGELDMLRGLIATLHAVAEHGDLDDVRKLLAEHQADTAAARDEWGKSSRTPADVDPDFFQPGRIYTAHRHADLRFECLALTADPDTGEQQAIGWRYGPPHNGVRHPKLAALGPEDWACCDWTASTTTTGKDGAL